MTRLSTSNNHLWTGDPILFRAWLARGLSTRVAACLSREGVRVAWAATMTDDDLLRIRNFGRGALAEVRARVPYQLHPEALCMDCGGENVVWFAPNDLWNRVMGSPNGIVCPNCFIKRAERAGLDRAAWRLEPEPFDTPLAQPPSDPVS